MTFFVLRGGQVLRPNGHYSKDDADRSALATLRRHPKATVRIVELIETPTLETAELAAGRRRQQNNPFAPEKLCDCVTNEADPQPCHCGAK